MQIVGIDIGTTSICGVVIDAKSGKVLRSETVNSDAFIQTSFPWEKIQSPEKIYDIAIGILDSLIGEETVSIGVTGQMHGIVYTNSSGNAISPLYTWQDGRGNLPYKDTTYAEYLGSHSGYGNVTDFYNCINGIRPEEAVSHCTIHDYFVMKICGLKRPIMHSSNGASLGLYDLEKHQFKCDVNADVINDYYVAGSYKNIPVGIAIGDNQASVFSTLKNENDVLINVGTGSQVSIISSEMAEGSDIEVRPYFDGKYLIVGAALCGGRAFSMLKDFYGSILREVAEIDDKQIYAIMDRWLDSPCEDPMHVDTRFAGTRRDTSIKGTISAISVENFCPSALTHGVLSGMVEELYEMYLQMNAKTIGIVGSGNGVRKNPQFIRLVEQQFGGMLKIPAHLEEAAFGAALFGAISAEIYEDSAKAQSIIRYN